MMKILKVSVVKILVVSALLMVSYSGVSQAATKSLGSQVLQTVPQVASVSTGLPAILVGPRGHGGRGHGARGPGRRRGHGRRFRGPGRRRFRRGPRGGGGILIVPPRPAIVVRPFG